MAHKKSFTLIELLIVITIIGILAVALIPRIAGAPARARDVQRKADFGQTQSALELYYADNGKYPSANPGSDDTDCLASYNTGAYDLTPYFNQGIPEDPTGEGHSVACSTGYAYSVNDKQTGYVLIALLENKNAGGEGVYCTFSGAPYDAADLSLGTLCDDGGSDGPWYMIGR